MNLFFDVIRQGDKYLQNWPRQRVLNCLFIDSKVVFYTALAIKIMPAFIFLTLAVNIMWPALCGWSVTMTFVFFLLGIPVQGLYWLGKRSQMLLPNSLLAWYSAIQRTIDCSHVEPLIIAGHPSYLDLALLLKKAFKVGGDKFLQQHELI